MAYFAKLGKGNIVQRVAPVSNDIAVTEEAGENFLNKLYNTNDVWKQTSYNTKGGIHLLGGTPFRKNYAQVGYKYDMYKDAFIPQKPFASWSLNETTCLWEAPVAKPDEDKDYQWDEEKQEWYLNE